MSELPRRRFGRSASDAPKPPVRQEMPAEVRAAVAAAEERAMASSGTVEAPDHTVNDLAPIEAPAEAVSASIEGFWSRWRVKPVEGDPHDAWGQQACSRCDTAHAMLVEPAGTRFACAHCGFQGDASVSPDRYAGRFALTDIRWPALQVPRSVDEVLAESGLTGSDATGMHLAQAYFDDHGLPGWRDALFLPVVGVTDGPIVDWLQVQLNDHGGLSDINRRAKAGQPYPWGWQAIDGEKVLLVERPVDRLALLLAEQTHAVCMPASLNPAHASGGDYSSLALIEEGLRTIKRVELAFQDDEAGHRLEEELSRRIGRDRCFRLRWQSHALPEGIVPSAQTVYAQYGAVGVTESLSGLSPYPVAGIYELVDVDEEFEGYYEFGFTAGPRVGYPSMDEFYAAPPGQLTTILGIPGHGKSTLAEEISVSLAERYDWSIGVFSPENQPVARYFASLTEKYVRKPFSDQGPHCPRMTREEKNAGKRWVQDHFRLILPDDEHGNWSLDAVLERARTLIFRHGIKGLILDPWNELDHQRPAHMTHDDYLALQLAKLKRFARVAGIHVWVVVHPTKLEHKADGRYPVPTPYTVAGGAMWFNKSDFILVPYRHRSDRDEEIVDVYSQKVRQREHGRVGMFSLYYNVDLCRYEDRVDPAKRQRSNEMKIPMESSEQLFATARPLNGTILPRDYEDPRA